MVGQVLSHYELIDKLGEGGMGVVYKARDTELGRLVAIKVLSADTTHDESRRRRFLQEARTASALNHQNIVTIHDIGHANGVDFIVMEYVDGRPLKSLIGNGLPAKEVATLARQIAGALAAAHAVGIIHRDIKPANILVTAAGLVKVLDFGLAKLIERASLSDTDPTLTEGERMELTERGMVLGTAAYMSPEQAGGRPVDTRSDVFSLGVVLYEMLSGRKPFQADTSLETMMAIVRDPAPPLADVPDEIGQIVQRALEKKVEDRISAVVIERGLAAYLDSLTAARQPLVGWIRRRRIAIPVLATLLTAVVAASYWFYQRGARVRWAREQAIPEIGRLVEQGKYFAAFDRAVEAEKLIPGHPELARLWADFSTTPSIDTNPPGADVYFQELGEPSTTWRYLGRSPVRGARVPGSFIRWRASKEGFDTSYLYGSSAAPLTTIVLDPKGQAPPGMVAVPTGSISYSIFGVGLLGPVAVRRYYIDQFEVTNRSFKEFVDQGGYRKREYWKHPFRKGTRTLTWEEAITEFRDSTGRLGPSAWEAGTYREGEAEMPVGGVSWYEAAAYAEFAGKRLPTIYHWYHAGAPQSAASVAPASNFSGKGPARVGATVGSMGIFGTFDMAGNNKEWCWNETDAGNRFILGGGWNEPSYAFVDPDARSPFDRSLANGFRCVRYTDPPPEQTLAPRRRRFRDYAVARPISDDAFRVIQSLYAVEHGPLDAKVESTDESSPHWRTEKVSYRAAYGRERVPAYLFLPKNAPLPYQTVVFFPGSDAIDRPSSANLEMARFDFAMRSGRAVLYPIYQGTFERRQGGYDYYQTPRLIAVQQFQDLSRSVDYLESRPDIDRTRLAYYGLSMGARLATIMLSMEGRFKTAVLLAGGFHLVQKPPEIDEFSFAPRVKIPALMVNGRHDYTFPFEQSQKQFFRWLGTPPDHKRHVVLETTHDVFNRRREVVREVLDWLDKYLGPVQRQP